MQWIERFDLFLFDLDGLLVNTEELHYQAYREVLRRRGYNLPWSLVDYYGAAHTGAGNIAEHLYRIFPELAEIEWNLLYAEKREILLGAMQGGSLQMMPGAERLLKLLAMKGIRHCVVTNSRGEEVALMQARLPALEGIPRWFTRENYKKAKPDPEGYQTAIAALGRAGDRVVGFEDSHRGLTALLGAGVEMPVLICSQNHPQMVHSISERVRHFPSFDVIDLD